MASIDEMIDKIIVEATKEIQDELTNVNDELENLQTKYSKLQNENKKLKDIVSKYNCVSEITALFASENFNKMRPLFNLKHNDIPINGMHADEIPDWFKYVFHYYEDKDKLFNIMDLFNIKYPEWAKNYKMPYDYTEDELMIFIDPSYSRTVCNGCYFEDNIGFFWENIQYCHADTNKILTNKRSFTDYIPWQLVLSNPLWSTDILFNKILEAIYADRYTSWNFFTIQKYTKISNDQILELLKLIPTHNLYGVHKEFLKMNENIIRGNSIFADKFKDEICDNSYSIYYYLNYPIEDQKNYIKTKLDFDEQMTLINKMEITKEEKHKFAVELLEISDNK